MALLTPANASLDALRNHVAVHSYSFIHVGISYPVVAALYPNPLCLAHILMSCLVLKAFKMFALHSPSHSRRPNPSIPYSHSYIQHSLPPTYSLSTCIVNQFNRASCHPKRTQLTLSHKRDLTISSANRSPSQHHAVPASRQQGWCQSESVRSQDHHGLPQIPIPQIPRLMDIGAKRSAQRNEEWTWIPCLTNPSSLFPVGLEWGLGPDNLVDLSVSTESSVDDLPQH